MLRQYFPKGIDLSHYSQADLGTIVLWLNQRGDPVRNLQAYLHPSSEHALDWFHVTMRCTVMKQQNKAIIEEDASLGTDAPDRLERVKHYLWHGNVDAALERVDGLLCELDMRGSRSTALAKLSRSLTEFTTSFQTMANGIVTVTPSARRSWSRPSIKSSANAS